MAPSSMTMSSHPAGRTQRGLRPNARLMALALWFAAAVAMPAPGLSVDEPEHGDPERGSPQTTMRAYLEAARAADYQRAAAYLDLRGLPPAARGGGSVLARQLKVVLDRTLWVELDELSDSPEGDRDDGLPPQRDLVGTIDTTQGAVPILVERVRDESGAWTWTIASATVARTPALYQEFGYGRLGEHLPPLFFQIQFLEIQLWQWVGLLTLIAVAAAASWIVAASIVRLVRPIVAGSRTAVDDRALQMAAGPVRLVIAVLLCSAGTYPLGLSVPAHAFVTALLKALLIVAITWLLVRIVDTAARVVEERLLARGQAAARSVVPLGRRTAQVLIVGLAALAVMQNLGVNVTGILAGLGIGGLAVALAAQKTVENLFGGVTLIADQPVRVGDFCRFADKVGTVEEVGLRSTRVRTLDRTVVTIPNAEFSAMHLENFTRRDRIWFHTTLGLRYETTPDQMRHVLVELKKLLVGHPKVLPDPARARFVGFGAYSLDIEIFAYVATSDYNEFLAIREDLLLRIMDLVAASGSSFAFPSQTIYAGADGGLDLERAQAAEAQVRQWRDANALGLPYFRPEQLASLAGSLAYPPEGSATRA